MSEGEAEGGAGGEEWLRWNYCLHRFRSRWSGRMRRPFIAFRPGRNYLEARTRGRMPIFTYFTLPFSFTFFLSSSFSLSKAWVQVTSRTHYRGPGVTSSLRVTFMPYLQQEVHVTSRYWLATRGPVTRWPRRLQDTRLHRGGSEIKTLRSVLLFHTFAHLGSLLLIVRRPWVVQVRRRMISKRARSVTRPNLSC